MKLILLADVKPLGKKDDIVDVSDGYAKNYLLPKKLAVMADAKALNEIKNREAAKLHAVEEQKAEAMSTAQRLQAVNVVIYLTAGGDKRAFGSVTSKDIAEALEKEHNIIIDRKRVVLDKPIKAYGTYEIDVKLYPGIIGKINLVVCSKQA